MDAIALESNHTLEIDSFVPREQIDERYLDGTYYMVPNDEVGQEAFAVIREAMRDKGMVALGRVVLSKRERVIALQPWEKGLLGATLRYASEVRDAKDYFDELPDVKVEREMLKLAEHILNTKKADFDPTEFVDHYEEALVDLLRQKQKGVPLAKQHASPQRRQPHGCAEAQHCSGYEKVGAKEQETHPWARRNVAAYFRQEGQRG